jgi:hypothetical protein
MSSQSQSVGSRGARRWMRFQLRTLFVLVTIAAVWLGLTMKQLRDRERAVSRILEFGGAVGYNYQFDPDHNYKQSAAPPGPQWLRTLFGPQCNVRVVLVELDLEGGSRATDQDLELLLNFPDLRALEWGNSPITDEGLRHIGRLKRLESLALKDCTALTDEGLSQLGSLQQLTNLSLVRCRMNGSGLRHLTPLPIQVLSLNYTPVTDDNLGVVATWSGMTNLTLQGTKLTDRALVNFRELKKLRELDLNRTVVSDGGLVHLTGLANLSHLLLSRTEVTDEGVDKLKRSLPNLKQVDH